MNFFKNAPTLAFPLVVLVATSMILFAKGHELAASLVSSLGTMVVMLANVVYIIGWHSRKRWPRASAGERTKRLFSFDRQR